MLDPSLLENLDGSWPNDLRAYAHRLRVAEVEPNDDETRLMLAKYASLKALAMEWRAAGNLARAVPIERQCEEIYGNLPDYAKW